MRRFIAGLLALVTIGALAGCTAPVVHKTAPTIHPTPTATPELLVAVPDGVMASGSFRSPDGTTRGQFEISHDSLGYVISFSHLHTLEGQSLAVSLTDSVAGIGECSDGKFDQLSFHEVLNSKSSLRPWRIDAEEEGGTDLAWVDLSFLKYLAVESLDNGGCGGTVVAAGKLAWRIPQTHPGIAVHDNGVQDSAWGKATDRGGKPFTYLTHQGDDWTHIAKRFGITKADLTWLNPVRIGGDKYEVAYENQELNLDPGNRGNSESRRHPM